MRTCLQVKLLYCILFVRPSYQGAVTVDHFALKVSSTSKLLVALFLLSVLRCWRRCLLGHLFFLCFLLRFFLLHLLLLHLGHLFHTVQTHTPHLSQCDMKPCSILCLDDHGNLFLLFIPAQTKQPHRSKIYTHETVLQAFCKTKKNR